VKRIARAMAMVGIALGGLVLPMAVSAEASSARPASPTKVATAAPAGVAGDVGTMAVNSGPYKDLGTCRYWMYAVRAAGRATSDCYWVYHQPVCPGGACSINNTGWWFTRY